jgi:hypothetical protein
VYIQNPIKHIKNTKNTIGADQVMIKTHNQGHKQKRKKNGQGKKRHYKKMNCTFFP